MALGFNLYGLWAIDSVCAAVRNHRAVSKSPHLYTALDGRIMVKIVFDILKPSPLIFWNVVSFITVYKNHK